MPEQERSQRPRPGFWAQALAILKLSAQAARNQFGRNLRSKKGMRNATGHKHDKGFILPLLFALLMLGITTNTCYQGVHGLARYADSHWPASQETKVIRVGSWVHFHLKHHETSPSKAEPSEIGEDLIDAIKSEEHLSRDAAVAREKELIAHLEKYGIDGFIVERSGNTYQFIDIRNLSDDAQSWLGRALALMLGLLFAALVLMPLSSRNKDLGATDEQLAWLFCLPLTGHEILSGRFTAAVFVKPLAWIILLPLFTVIFWAIGYGVASILISLIVSLAIALATAGIELAIETTLRANGSFRFKKNIQSIATIFGTLALMLAMAVNIAALRSVGWINWILDNTPRALTDIPGRLILLPADHPAGLVTTLGSLFALATACGFLGWILSARALRTGLSSGSERAGIRSAGAATASVKASSFAKFEWLLLLRDRNFATTVLVLPLIMVLYQALVNPEMLNNISAEKLAVFGFGCGIWTAITSAPHVLLSESNSLWIIFSLPVKIGEHFHRRTRVWRATGVGMAILIITIISVWKGFPSENGWRIIAALIGVWVISQVVYAIMLGNAKLPDAAKGERPKISITRVYACMIVAGIVGAVIWHGTLWQILATLVLMWFYGFGLWQGVSNRLQYLLEPTATFPVQLSLASAVFAVVIFSFVQTIAAAIFTLTLFDDLSGAVLLSYIIGGVAAVFFCAFCNTINSAPKITPSGTKLAVTLPIYAAVCITAGWVWITLLHHFPPLRELYESAKSGIPQIDPGDWKIIALAVIAAPIVEEFIFRGFVLRIMQSVWKPRNAILANALIFAIVHPAFSFPPVFILGAANAWLYTRTQKIWPGILLHTAYNAAIVSLQ